MTPLAPSGWPRSFTQRARMAGESAQQAEIFRDFSRALLRQSLSLEGHSASLEAPAGEGLLASFSALERERLAGIWGQETLRELEFLSRESQSELYFHSLLLLARRHQDDSPALAAILLNAVSQEGRQSAPEAAQAAASDLAAQLGQGSFGARFEFQAQHFVREVTRPAPLMGMIAAGGVFSVGRSFFLSRLLSGAPGALTRGLAAETLASTGAFLFEAPTFVLGTHLAEHLLPGTEAQRSRGLGQEVLSAYFSLAGLKIFGALGTRATQWSGATGFSQAFFPQASMYLGILAGHGLERWAGLDTGPSSDHVFFDSFVTLLNFQIGGRLSQEIMGRRWQRFQEELHLRTLSISDRRPPSENQRPRFFPILEPSLALPGGGAFIPGGESFAEGLGKPMVMAMANPGEIKPGSTLPELAGADTPSPRGTKEVAPDSTPNWGERLFPLLEQLVRMRDQARQTEASPPSLMAIFREQVKQGNIAADLHSGLRMGIFYREIYEASPLLQREIKEEDLSSAKALTDKVLALRDRINEEGRSKKYALTSLIQALTFGGRVPPERARRYLNYGASRSLYLNSALLRESFTVEDFNHPAQLVAKLRNLRGDIAQELGREHQLSTLISAIAQHPDFPEQKVLSHFYAGAAVDRIESLDREALGLTPKSLRKMNGEDLLLHLLRVKARLADQSQELSIGTLLQGLRALGLARVRGQEINDSYISSAHFLNQAYENWALWGGHFRNLAFLPKNGYKGASRLGYARSRILQESGQSYSDSTLSAFTRWGVFLFQNRKGLGLSEPESIAMPSRDTEDIGGLREIIERDPGLKEPAQHEEFLLRLLEVRNNLPSPQNPANSVSPEPVEVRKPSLRTLVGVWSRVRETAVDRTLKVYAYHVDAILKRWETWNRHFSYISRLPASDREFSREDAARERLHPDAGGVYSKTVLYQLIRWGVLLWENRSRLGLEETSASESPPDSQRLPQALLMREFFLEHASDPRLKMPLRYNGENIERLIGRMIELRPQLESWLQTQLGSDAAEGGKGTEISLRQMSRAYQKARESRAATLETAAEEADTLFNHWEELGPQFRLLARFQPKAKLSYSRELFPELNDTELKLRLRMGQVLLERKKNLGFESQPGPFREIPPPAVEWYLTHAKRLATPAWLTSEKANKIFGELMVLRNEMGERIPQQGTQEEAATNPIRLTTLIKLDHLLHGTRSFSVAEQAGAIDQMLQNWEFWRVHLPTIAGLEPMPALRYLRTVIQEHSSQEQVHLRLGKFLWEHRREFGLEPSP